MSVLYCPLCNLLESLTVLLRMGYEMLQREGLVESRINMQSILSIFYIFTDMAVNSVQLHNHVMVTSS